MRNSTQLKRAISVAETQIKASEKVLELTQYKPFQEIVLDAYINTGIEQLLSDRVDPNKQTEAELALNTKHIDGIASFKGWLNAQLMAGSQAESALVELKAELDIAYLEEEASND